jgi:heme/copper-type cytochrome/quinol oxidase subunit 2
MSKKDSIKKERAMHNRTTLIIVAIIGIILLATGGTVGALALTHSGFMGNNGNGNGFMRNNGNGNGMMGGQQSPVNQGTLAPATTHLTIDIIMNQPGMQKDWPAFSPSNLVVPANSLITVTMRDHDLGNTAMLQNSPFTTVQGTVGTNATVDGREYASLAPDKIAHTFTIPQLNVNVPLPGDGMKSKDFNTVTFSFRTGAAGTYAFRCLDPCGTGPMGMMGPMQTQGYMMGTLVVQ